MSNVLFRLEDGELKLNTEELRLVPEFNALVRRDRGSEGDADGRLKKYAFKEFKYIYFFADLKSPYSRLSDKERHKKAVLAADLPELFKGDKIIKEAITAYVELYYANRPSLKVLVSLERALDMSDRILTTLIKSTEAKLAATMQAIDTDPMAVVGIDALTESLNSLMKLSTSIPQTLEVIESIRNKAMAEEGSTTIKRGGETRGNREDADYIKRKFGSKALVSTVTAPIIPEPELPGLNTTDADLEENDGD